MFQDVAEENPNSHTSPEVEETAIDPALIREELRRIVSSRHFQTSRRGKEFLEHVVNQKINGHGDLLKERLIGVQIFGRKPDYSTGEDPVVRVQAGDVRRRLERYHADADIHPEVLIDIPLGSYAPVFRLRHHVPAHESTDDSEGKAQTADLGEEFEATALLEADDHGGKPYLGGDLPLTPKAEHGTRRTLWWWALPVLACLALIGYLASQYIHRLPDSITRAFWAPASAAAKPVLLCLPRPMVYRPSEKLFDRYQETHPDAFTTRESRQDQVLPLEPTDTIQWSSMIPVRASGPGIGGVIAAVNMSRLLTEQGIRFELRFGKEATYAEMRDSPVVIVGGINTEWSTQLIAESTFAFDETPGSPNIHERAGAKRMWKQESKNGVVTRDYGLITRQLKGRAGQFLVQVAGISHFATAAASEFLMQPNELEKVLRSESIDPQKKNLQIVIATDITDERAGPPHVVAVSSW